MAARTDFRRINPGNLRFEALYAGITSAIIYIVIYKERKIYILLSDNYIIGGTHMDCKTRIYIPKVEENYIPGTIQNEAKNIPQDYIPKVRDGYIPKGTIQIEAKRILDDIKRNRKNKDLSGCLTLKDSSVFPMAGLCCADDSET